MGVFEQELPAYPLRAVFDEAAESIGDQALDDLLAEREVTRKALEDPLVWVSLEFVEWLFAAIEERVRDGDFIARAAARSASARYMGPLFTLLVAFGSPLFTYRQLPEATRRLNKLAKWEIREAQRGSARLVWIPTPGKAQERTRAVCRFRSAQLALVPTVFGLPSARIEHPECMLDGHPTCVYQVTWSQPQPRTHAVAGLLGGLSAGAVLAGVVSTPLWHASIVTLGLAAGGFAVGRAFMLRQDLRARTREIDDHNRALEQVIRSNEERYAELLEAKSQVDKKVEQRTAELQLTSQRLSETLSEIQELDRAKTEFFNNVSHELRSPLTLILAPLGDLVAGRAPAGGQAAAFDAMYRSASRLLRLINQLLDLAKIDAGEMRLSLVSSNVLLLTRSALTAFEAAAAKKGVELSFRGPDGLSPIAIDAAWIESAVTNLVANALRLTPSGSSVQVLVEDYGSDVAISVTDGGPGIAPEDRTKIFERFAQGDSTTRVIGGTGIGLALVREAARLHGGDVKVISELGKGARFTLTLPRRTDVQVDLRPTSASLEQTMPTFTDDVMDDVEELERSGPGANAALALVVEDNPELRVFVADVLAVRYRVRAVSDGAKALALLSDHGLRPDVIVSDVAMPVMDGYTLCKRLRANPQTSGIPVLLVTARTEINNVLTGFEAGANDYVLKPFHGRELLARVDAHVKIRRMAQELVLRERHAMLGVLAASVAHQVRNPLTTLVSGLPAMRARLDGRVSQSTFELIDMMMECASRIERLTGDLVDLSRVDREEGGDFRPSDGLQSAIRMVRARVPDNVVIEDHVETSPIIQGRPGDVNHVFMNVLDNAVRAVAAGGKVTVDAALGADAYVVRIADDGPGVEPSVAERIFEPFFTTRPAGEGTGLGLAIAQQVMQQCGGSIRVGRSQLGGAEFVIEMPLAGRIAPESGLVTTAREALH